MRSGNPTLTAKTFTGLTDIGERMTLRGAVHKTFLMLVVVVLGATIAWNEFAATGAPPAWAWWGSLVGLVLGLVITFRPALAPTLAPF